MAIRTFTYVGLARPAPGTSYGVKPRINSTPFGDGYKQETGDGINILERKCKVSFQVINAAEKNAMEAFFAEHKGYIPFLWKYPGDPAALKWKARSWDISIQAHDVYTFDVEFERDFSN